MIHEHHLRVERTARWASLGEPGPPTREIWIACHGYAQLARRFLRPFERIAGVERVVAAPEALNRFYLESPTSIADAAERRVGATWMTREDRDHEIADQIGYLDRLAGVLAAQAPAARVVALGFSQGVAVVCRWLAGGTTRASRVILWGGTVPPELDLAPLADRLAVAAVTFVAATDDRIVPGERVERDAERFRRAGVACDVVRFAGTHVVDGDTLARLAPVTSP